MGNLNDAKQYCLGSNRNQDECTSALRSQSYVLQTLTQKVSLMVSDCKGRGSQCSQTVNAASLVTNNLATGLTNAITDCGGSNTDACNTDMQDVGKQASELLQDVVTAFLQCGAIPTNTLMAPFLSTCSDDLNAVAS